MTDPAGLFRQDEVDCIRTARRNTAPTISDTPNQTIDNNTSTGPIGFTVADAETAAINLVMRGSSANPALVPNGNIVFGGSGATRTVTVTPAAGQSGRATITLTVSDGALQATDTFVLSVLSVPADFTLSGSPASRLVVPGGTTTYGVTITPSGGFTGPVTLSVSGLPTGATGSFAPNPATASSTLTVTTSREHADRDLSAHPHRGQRRIDAHDHRLALARERASGRRVRRGWTRFRRRGGGEQFQFELEPHGERDRGESAADGRRRGGQESGYRALARRHV